METLKRILLALVIIGAINWGLIGFFQFDLVASLFGGQDAALARLIYALVGISGIFCLGLLFSPMENVRSRGVRSIEADRVNYGTEFGEETTFTNDPKHPQNPNRHL